MANQGMKDIQQDYSSALEQLRMHEVAELFHGGGSWVYDIPAGQITVSKGWQEIHGTKQSVFSIPELMPIAYPDDKPAIELAFKNSVEKGASYQLTHRIIRQDDGSIRVIKAYAEVMEKDADHKPRKMFGMVKDITAYSSTLSERDSAVERFRLAKEIAEIGVFEFNTGNGDLIWDETIYELYGVEHKTVSYDDWKNALHPDEMLEVESDLQTAIENRSDFDRVFRIIRHGDVRYIHCIASFINEFMLGVNMDITDQMQMKEELRQSQKMEAIGHLAGGIAHDFNNQLASIMGFAELLEAHLQDSALIKFARKIISAAEHSANLTTQLLTFSRKQNLHLEVVNIHQQINDVIELLNRSIDKRIEIETHFNADQSNIMGDKSLIQNVFLNLGLNSRDAMPEGGVISISTQHIDASKLKVTKPSLKGTSFIKVDFKDSGCGISEEYRGKIFEPFFTTKELGKGTGMGLASVYGAIQQLDGAIEVDSIIGEGTCITIFLPATESKIASQLEEDNDTIRKSKQSKTILVVDDEELILELSKDFLDALGHQSVFAADGKEALEIYKHNWRNIDLVILDMMMPGLSGRDVFEALKKINPSVKVIISSGYTADNSLTNMLELGVSLTIQKPFKLATLKSSIDLVLESN